MSLGFKDLFVNSIEKIHNTHHKKPVCNNLHVSLKFHFSRQDASRPQSLELDSTRTGGHPDHRSTLPVP